MKKMILIISFMLAVALAASACTQSQGNIKPGDAFSFQYGIFIPGPGTPVQLNGASPVASQSLGNESNPASGTGAFSSQYGIFIPGRTPIQLNGGSAIAPQCLGDESQPASGTGAFSFQYGILISGRTPIQLNGGSPIASQSLGGK